MQKIRLATVFSGIGAVEQALHKLEVDYEIIFACDTGERYIDLSYEEIIENYKVSDIENLGQYVKKVYEDTKKINHVKTAYFENYEISEDRWHDDIRFIDGTEYKDEIDILVGGSPCQSFSIIGKRAGLEDARGTLFYDFARLINESQPKAFIYENVLGMMSHDQGRTWKHITEIFEELGYRLFIDVLNAKDYGIPQNRKRLFVVGMKSNKMNFKFPEPIELTTTMFDYLESDIEPRHFLGKKGFEFVTNPKYKVRARVNQEIIQTQKANQQFNWNGDFVFVPIDKIKENQEIMKRAYIGEFRNQKGAIRQLNHRECLRLMGFSDDFKIVVPNVQAYRQAGNSIVVNVLEGIVSNIIDELDKEDNDEK